MAVDACKQENSQQVRARENMQMVKETLNEGYCDGSGEAIDLIFIGVQDVATYVIASLMLLQAIWVASRFMYPEVCPSCNFYFILMLTI